MVMTCGNTTNIPVAGATDCTTAKAAAWTLLTTLLQTPNCMSSGCPAGYTVGQGISTCTPDPYTRPNGSAAMRWRVTWTWTCTPPPCCNYQFDLSTGQGNGPQDALWKVDGNPSYIVTTPAPNWLTAPFAPAQWIQKKNSTTPKTLPAGTNCKYRVKFNVPSCPVGTVHLTGTFAADNSAKAKLDGVPIPGASCPGPVCFWSPQAPVSLNGAPAIAAGTHTLEIKVHNISGYSGLIVKAQLTRTCP